MLEGGDTIGALSTASSNPLPKVAKGANGAIAAAIAAFDKNDLLEFDIVLVFLLKIVLMIEVERLWNSPTFQR